MRARGNFPLHAGLGLALVGALLAPGSALAHTTVRHTGLGAKVKHVWQFRPCPRQVINTPNATCPSPVTFPWKNIVSRQTQGNRGVPGEPTCACSVPNCQDWVIQSGGCDASGHLSSYAIAGGVWTQAGAALTRGGPRFSIAAVSDTAFVSDSIVVHVVRSPGTVTIDNFQGELRNNPGLNHEVNGSTFVLAVYPDTNAANADSNLVGTGAVFFGRVSSDPPGPVSLSGGFGAGDFTLSRTPNGATVVTPAGGLSKVIPVTDSNAAAVVMSVDPRVGLGVLPATSPPLLVLVSVVLLGSGVMFLLRRGQTA